MHTCQCLCHAFGALGQYWQLLFAARVRAHKFRCLVPAAESKSQAEPAGVYCTVTVDGINWLKPYPAHKCDDHARRAYDLPVNGELVYLPDGITFLVHRNVPCRLPPRSQGNEQSVDKVSCRLPPYMCQIWSE